MKINLELGKAISLLNDFLMEHAKSATEDSPYEFNLMANSVSLKKAITEADKLVTENETLLAQYSEYSNDFSKIPEPFITWEDSKEYD